MMAQPGDRGLHLPLVRRAAPSQLRHGGDPGDGLPDPAGAHGGPGRAGPGDGQGARRALRVGPGALALPLRDARREQVPRRPPRPRRASWWTCPAATGCARPTSPGGSWTACVVTRRTSAPPTSWTASTTCSTGQRRRLRQLVVFEANHDLREVVGEIVEASVPLSRSSEPAGPLRRLQELRVRGLPVRHRVPVLRPAGAQARPEAGARRRGRRRARQAAPPAQAVAPAAGGDRGHRARHAAHRRRSR